MINNSLWHKLFFFVLITLTFNSLSFAQMASSAESDSDINMVFEAPKGWQIAANQATAVTRAFMFAPTEEINNKNFFHVIAYRAYKKNPNKIEDWIQLSKKSLESGLAQGCDKVQFSDFQLLNVNNSPAATVSYHCYNLKSTPGYGELGTYYYVESNYGLYSLLRSERFLLNAYSGNEVIPLEKQKEWEQFNRSIKVCKAKTCEAFIK